MNRFSQTNYGTQHLLNSTNQKSGWVRARGSDEVLGGEGGRQLEACSGSWYVMGLQGPGSPGSESSRSRSAKPRTSQGERRPRAHEYWKMVRGTRSSGTSIGREST
ncbi:hypothetical protein L6452_02203 [Arctium lappa]|uniref:Uncharacterized protein n=1 Tax=Arctium lappa TaxID=4217 RepID=A0ACB9FJ91_ARCLA|nr:hypothetical protein L6452_02203 [Arctium lappa]